METKYTAEEQKIVDNIIELERSALEKYFKGDMSGYLNLWSKTNFSYFDANCAKRIDDYKDIKKFLLDNVEGKMHADSFDYYKPRVQLGKDMAVLTYQLHSDTNFIEMHYNVIEVFQLEGSEWKVIHSTWDLIQPFGDIKRPKVKVTV